MRIKKSLKKEPIFYGIKVCDSETIGNKRSCGRSPARPNRDTGPARIVNEVGHDKKIAGKSHFCNNIKFKIQPGFVFFSQFPGYFPFSFFSLAQSFPETLSGVMGDQFIEIFFALSIKNRIFIVSELHFISAGSGYLNGCVESLDIPITQRSFHFLSGFEPKFVGREFHTLGVINHLSGLDTQECIMGLGIPFV